MTDDEQQQMPAQESQQYQQPPAPPKKGGAIKIIAVVAVVAIVIIAALAVVMTMGPGFAGKWNVVSVKATIMFGGNETVVWDNSTGNWVEFKSDGTGVNNVGDSFNWEASDGRLTITSDTNDAFGTMGVPFDYTLEGDVMTIRGMLAAGTYMVMTLNRA